MDGEQVLTFYWIDPIDAADRMVARPEFADHFYFHYERQESEQRPGKRAFGRANSGIVFQQAQLLDMFSVPMLHLFYGDKSFSGAHRGHYPIYGEDDRKYAKYAFLHVICNHDTNMHLYINYNKHIIIMKAISFPENLLNVHEDLRRKTWFPVAWMPIYDPNRSKRPTQGYQCDAARQMRLFHDCWRKLLGRWNEKTEKTRLVIFADQTRHQVRSFLGGLLGDQQVWTISILLHILFNFAFLCISPIVCIFYIYLHKTHFSAYSRNMIASLVKEPWCAIAVLQGWAISCLMSGSE